MRTDGSTSAQDFSNQIRNVLPVIWSDGNSVKMEDLMKSADSRMLKGAPYSNRTKRKGNNQNNT